jgi:hypothetical protein
MNQTSIPCSGVFFFFFFFFFFVYIGYCQSKPPPSAMPFPDSQTRKKTGGVRVNVGKWGKSGMNNGRVGEEEMDQLSTLLSPLCPVRWHF